MKKILLAALIFFAAGPAFSAGYKRPKNPRKKPRRPAAAFSAGVVETSTGTHSVERSTLTAVVVPPAPKLKQGLLSGRWAPKVKAAIEELAVEYGRLSPRYDETSRPVAVLAWDGFCARGDAGEQLLLKLVGRAAFRFDDDFWKIIPIAYGRQRLRAAHEQFAALPQESWDSQPAYHQFRKGFMKGWREMCAGLGTKDCRLYLAKVLRGFGESEIAGVAAAAAEEEAGRIDPAVEEVREWPEDPFPVRVRLGLFAPPEARDLAALLLREGFEVWLADPLPQPVLEAAAKALGYEGARLAGLRQGLFRERLTGIVEEPAPFRGGKVELLAARTRRVPVLVLAASLDDEPLLSHGEGLRVLVDPGGEDARDKAKARGWLLQPAF